MPLTLVGKSQNMRRKSRIGQLVVVLIGTQLLFLATFLGLNLPTATEGNLIRYVRQASENLVARLPGQIGSELKHNVPELAYGSEPIRMSIYVPEAPVAIFVGYVLGPLLAPISAIVFLVIGFLGPHLGIFAFSSGGGIEYFKQPGFGYLLGMVVACWVTGRLTVQNRTSKRQCLAVVCGLLSVHLFGIGYMLIAALISSFGAQPGDAGAQFFWQPWIFEEVRNLTWYVLPYDILLSVVAIGLGFPFRWLVATLIAPDIASKQKAGEKFKDLL
ncbi:MAG: biotin transporter BioY [Candidatus Obscuribacterales bacterium]|nr:biotin transporter BioY [Candidatus Obscuribacterales bacterium]